MKTEEELKNAVNAALQRALNLLPEHPQESNEELETVLSLMAEIRKLREKETGDA